ncbi:hypothetical protein EV127DRAFT_474737 [Xylaria flabelliformis]|nr:hypothetical protein EV127DRAFT_474737 [Xylaria flabelliformis]
MYFRTLALAALSIGSVFAAPTAVTGSDPKILTSAIGAVADAKIAVDTQADITKNLVIGTVNNEVVPAVKASLNNIAGELQKLVSFVDALLTGIVLPLAEAEFNNIPGFVADVESISADVQVTVNLILANLPAELLVLVKHELLLVLAAVDPFVLPVLQFANSVIAGTSGSVTVTVSATVVRTQVIAGQIDGPIYTAVSKIN